MVDIYLDIRSFIEYKLRVNAGSQVGIEAPSKDEIIQFCTEQGIDVKGCTKEEIVNRINEFNISDEELVKHFFNYLGIHSSKFQEKFGVDHKTIKKLESKGLLPVIFKQRIRVFGKYIYVPMYSALVYFDTVDNFKILVKQLDI